MLVLPVSLTLGILLPIGRRGRWIGDFRDEKCRRGLSDAVYEYTQQRNLEEDKEANAETE